jgi:hypothetical protein
VLAAVVAASGALVSCLAALAIADITRLTNALESTRRVLAPRVLAALVVVGGAFIEVLTARAVALVASFAFALKAARCISAAGVFAAVVAASGTLVDVFASGAVACVTGLALALVAVCDAARVLRALAAARSLAAIGGSICALLERVRVPTLRV